MPRLQADDPRVHHGQCVMVLDFAGQESIRSKTGDVKPAVTPAAGADPQTVQRMVGRELAVCPNCRVQLRLKESAQCVEGRPAREIPDAPPFSLTGHVPEFAEGCQGFVGADGGRVQVGVRGNQSDPAADHPAEQSAFIIIFGHGFSGREHQRVMGHDQIGPGGLGFIQDAMGYIQGDMDTRHFPILTADQQAGIIEIRLVANGAARSMARKTSLIFIGLLLCHGQVVIPDRQRLGNRCLIGIFCFFQTVDPPVHRFDSIPNVRL